MDGGLDQARSLRELFASMSHSSADPAELLAQAGHGDLPSHLVTEAIISYADSAPVEVAEHLSPYVVAHSAVPAPDGQAYPGGDLHDGFALLTSAPTPVDMPHDDLDPLGAHHDGAHDHHLLDDVTHSGDTFHDVDHGSAQGADHGDHTGDHAAGQETHPGEHATGDLWFGHGQAAALAGHPAGDALPGTDDTTDHRFADAGHTDPWLVGHEDAAPDHSPATGDDTLGLWGTGADTHDPDTHDATHPHAIDVDEPGAHDLPIDPGHA